MTTIANATDASDSEEAVTVPKEDWEEFTNEIEALKERVDTLSEHRQRYKTLRDIVVSTTDLDAETLDQLVEQRMERGDDE